MQKFLLIVVIALVSIVTTTTQFVSAKDTTELSFDSLRITTHQYYSDYATKDLFPWNREPRSLTSESASEETSWLNSKANITNGAVLKILIFFIAVIVVLLRAIYLYEKAMRQ